MPFSKFAAGRLEAEVTLDQMALGYIRAWSWQKLKSLDFRNGMKDSSLVENWCGSGLHHQSRPPLPAATEWSGNIAAPGTRRMHHP